LGEFLESNCPDVSVKTVIKDHSEWDEFVDSVCRSYGFENKYHPLIYTIEGKIIGGALEFKEHVKDRYDKMLTIPKETQKARAKLTNDDNDEAMRRKKDGDTLNEKIEETLAKL